MARLQGAAGTGPVADLIRERRGGALGQLDELLLLSPPVAEGWSALLGAIRGETVLDGALRELVILRIAVLNGAGYEWAAHELTAVVAAYNMVSRFLVALEIAAAGRGSSAS